MKTAEQYADDWIANNWPEPPFTGLRYVFRQAMEQARAEAVQAFAAEAAAQIRAESKTTPQGSWAGAFAECARIVEALARQLEQQCKHPGCEAWTPECPNCGAKPQAPAACKHEHKDELGCPDCGELVNL